jgi:hypothetical protein
MMLQKKKKTTTTTKQKPILHAQKTPRLIKSRCHAMYAIPTPLCPYAPNFEREERGWVVFFFFLSFWSMPRYLMCVLCVVTGDLSTSDA